MTLEELLEREAQGWLADATLTPDQAEALTRKVLAQSRRRRYLRGVAVAVAAVAVLGLVGAALKIPVVEQRAAAWPVIGPLLSRLDQWGQSDRPDQHNALTPSFIETAQVTKVNKSALDQGITLTVNQATASSEATSVNFTLAHDALLGDEQFHWEVYYGAKQVPPDQVIYLMFGRQKDNQASGTLILPSLPKEQVPVRVELTRESAGAPAAHWSVSFPLAQSVVKPAKILATNIPVDLNGYHGLIEQIALTPTETILRLNTPTQPLVAYTGLLDLYAGTRRLGFQGTVQLPSAAGQNRMDWVYARLTGDEKSLTLRTNLTRLTDGGPVVPLTEGAVFQDADLGITMTVDRVTVGPDKSRVVLRAKGGDSADPLGALSVLLNKYAFQIVDADGNSPSKVSHFWMSTDAEDRLAFDVPGAIKLPATLQAKFTRVDEPFSTEIEIPLK